MTDPEETRGRPSDALAMFYGIPTDAATLARVDGAVETLLTRAAATLRSDDAAVAAFTAAQIVE